MSAEPSIYTLNHGVQGHERARLDKQHYSWLQLTEGRLIPPNIENHLKSLGRDVAIADAGTGSGIWLTSLASSLPSTARLDGYDFDGSKFPSRSELPANVNLHLGDVFKPFPADLAGLYDLVHVRALTYALKADQWRSVTTNLLSLVRPGGYLMWEDTGYTSWQCVPMTESFAKLLGTDARYAKSVGRDLTAPLPLKRYFEQAGLINCTREEYSTYSLPTDVQKTAGLVVPDGVGKVLQGVAKNGGFEWVQSAEDVEVVMDAIRADINNGVVQVGYSFHWTVGQRPE